MKNPEELQPQNFVIKVVLVGNPQVGKSVFLKRWNNAIFIENNKATIGVDFDIKDLPKEGYDLKQNEKVAAQIWDIAGSEKQHSTLANYFKETTLFIIMISSRDSVDARIQQIKDWRDIIKNKSTDQEYKIIIIENQIDVGTPFTLEQVASAKDIDENYVAISTNNKINFDQLENILAKILSPFISKLKSAALQQALLQIHTNPPIDKGIIHKINELNKAHAELLLHYIEDFIRYGTTDNPSKPYDLTFFSGVLYQYETDLQDDLHSRRSVTLQLPEHVPDLLNYIKNRNLTPAKDILMQIYVKSLEIATSTPFFRKSTTQQFYAHSLPAYINKSITPETFRNYQTIKTLKKENITRVLVNLRDFILLGVHNNRNNPYTIGFCGGTPYSYDTHRIKLPKHLAVIIDAIDKICAKNNVKDEEYQSCLSDIYHKIIAASVLPAHGRDTSTQNFYDNLLLDKLKSEITDKAEVSDINPSSPGLSTSL